MMTEETKKPVVLVVDDEPDILESLEIILEAGGNDVIRSADGESAVSQAFEKKPDLILLDVLLPGINGYQVCQILKQDDRTKEVPIILLTAKARESDRRMAKEVGADEYMTKPFDLDSLLAAVRCHT